MTDDSTHDTAAAVRLVVRAQLDQLADVRRRLTSTVLGAGSDRALAHDVALAASELCTNVIQYAATDEFTVTCELADTAWILEVSHADGVELDPPVAESPSAQGGRGLMIVRALMDTVDLVDTSDGRSIRCTVSSP